MMEIWVPLVGGLVLLLIGGELLVRGAVQLAEQAGVSPLVIGLTLVGFGTSMPELVTSVQAALAGSPGVAWGNVVGSNLANILLIIGASALLCPIRVASIALRRDAMVMLAVTVIFVALAFVIPVSRGLGLLCVSALVVYIIVAIWQERSRETHGAVHEKAAALAGTHPQLAPADQPGGRVLVPLLTAIGGLVVVIAGGSFLVNGAVALARSFEISETVIGLTIVAIGTSMPELVTSVVAAFKRQSDVAFGNIVGSNIYNILGIGGTTALIAPAPVPAEIVHSDNLLMLGATVVLVIFSATGLRINRTEGLALLAAYGGYLYMMLP